MKNKWESLVDLIVDSLGYFIVRFSPVIAPIPSIAVILEVTGYSTFAWLTVITVEAVGYALGEKMITAVKRGVLPVQKASIPLIIYALIIEGLMLGYSVIPAWMGEKDLAFAIKATVSMLYPFFTLAGAGLYAFHEYLKEVAKDTDYSKENNRVAENEIAIKDREIAHQKKLLELEDYKRKLETDSASYRLKIAQDLELEKQKTVAELRIKEDKAKAKLDNKSDSQSDSQSDSGIDYDSVIIKYFSENPLSSQRKAANDLKISQPKISKTLSLLESNKRIHRNGNGVEIL